MIVNGLFQVFLFENGDIIHDNEVMIYTKSQVKL